MQTQIKAIETILKSDATLRSLLEATVNQPRILPAISDTYEVFPVITYDIVDSSFRTSPHSAQDITVQFNIYSKSGRVQVENIFSRLNELLNYYKSQTKT